MSSAQKLTIDTAGRILIPKALRTELGVVAGQPLRARVRDGRLEIEAEDVEAELVESDGLLVIVPSEPVPALDRESVRDLLEALRR